MGIKRQNAWVFVVVSGLSLAIVAVLVYIAYLSLSPVPARESDAPLDYSGISVLEAGQAMPDFTLTRQDGTALNLRDLTGKPVLISFGFTHCPDVCPFTLGEFRNIHAALGDDLYYVLISVDGERDTPEVLRTYFETLRVDSFLIGLTGAETTVRELMTDYGATFFYSERDANGNYEVDHTAGMFLLDSEQAWIRRYAYGTARQSIINDLQGILGR